MLLRRSVSNSRAYKTPFAELRSNRTDSSQLPPENRWLEFSAIGRKSKSMPVRLVELAAGREAPGFCARIKSGIALKIHHLPECVS